MIDAIALQQVTDEEDEIVAPDVSNLVTEDDTPVDGIFSERQMRLLTDSLYTSWAGPGAGRTFVAMANVALYASTEQPPLVPDVLVSLDVQLPASPFPKQNRSYFIWQYGKPPEVAIEVVSNRKGGELGNKLLDYARLGIAYYVVYDPEGHLSAEPLRIFARQETRLFEMTSLWLRDLDLGFVLWQGEYEGMQGIWLRWCNQAGEVLATGVEAATAAQRRAESESRRAESEHERAEQLAAKLRALGIDPDVP